MQKLTLSQLESFLWKSAEIVRGCMDSSIFSNYVFGMLVLKRLSDTFDEARERVISNNLGKGKSQSEAEDLSDDQDQYDNTFYIPEKARWNNLKDLNHDIGAELSNAAEAIEEINRSLEGVLVSFEFNINWKSQDRLLNDRILKDLLSHFSTLRLRDDDFERDDLLGLAFGSLVRMFADLSDKRGGESYTPDAVVKLLVALQKPLAGMRVYDPTCGSGGMLIQTKNYLVSHGENPDDLQLYGQDINSETWSICNLNMLFNNVKNFDIRLGHTLINPLHIDDGNLRKFDRVIASPPFSLANWGSEYAEKDPFNRFRFGIPPKSSGDFAFIQHMIASLDEKGLMCSIVPNGVLFRGGIEYEVRKNLIRGDLIEAVISLPSGLFHGTNIPTSVIIINKDKMMERKGKVLFIDASHDYGKHRGRRVIRDEDIEKILKRYDEFADYYDDTKENLAYARVVDILEIVENQSSLLVKRYADVSPVKVQTKRLIVLYKDYKVLPLKELAVEVNLGSPKSIFVERPNAIYVPRMGSHRSVSKLEDLAISHKNAYQIILDSQVVLAEYMEIFLKSELGLLVMKEIESGKMTRVFGWNDQLSEMTVLIPNIKNQNDIINASNRLEVLKQCIEKLEKNMALSSINTHIVLEQAENMLSVVGGLTDAERVMSLISKGESGNCEFKESFGLDVRKGTQEKYIEMSSLKTIAAFLNTDGGTLLVGVNDEGSIPGLDHEVRLFHKGKTDKFLLHFKNQLKSKIGEEFYPYVDHKVVLVGGLEVLMVQVDKSSKACYLDDKDFYVRTNPATDRLEGRKLVEYIQNHFP